MTSVGNNIVIGTSKFVSAGTVALTGTIAVNATSIIGTSNFVVTLTPSWNGSTVNWTCNATPAKYGPSSCRG